MIEYKIITNDTGEVVKIDFTFSQLFLYGETGKEGDVTIFPVFVEVIWIKDLLSAREKQNQHYINTTKIIAFRRIQNRYNGLCHVSS